MLVFSLWYSVFFTPGTTSPGTPLSRAAGTWAAVPVKQRGTTTGRPTRENERWWVGCHLAMKPLETIWNQLKSWFSQSLYKTQNISQNLKYGLTALKTPHTAESKAWLKVSPKMNPNTSLYKTKNLLGDDSRYPIISHTNWFVPSINLLDFVGKIFGGIICRYLQTIDHVSHIIIYVFFTDPEVRGCLMVPRWTGYDLILNISKYSSCFSKTHSQYLLSTHPEDV